MRGTSRKFRLPTASLVKTLPLPLPLPLPLLALALALNACGARGTSPRGSTDVPGARSGSASERAGEARARRPSRSEQPAAFRNDGSLHALALGARQPEEPGVPASIHRPLRTELGKASYYSDALAGHRTANGEYYHPRKFTAAHRKLPFGTLVRVVEQQTHQSVVVVINDRGPFGRKSRIIDLSRAAAEKLGMLRRGVVSVRVEVLQLGRSKRR